LATVVIAASKCMSEATLLLEKKRRLRNVVVNSGGTIISNAAAGGAFHALHGEAYLYSGGLTALRALPALAALAALYYGLETLVVFGAIATRSQERPWMVFYELTHGTVLGEVSLILVGIVFGVMCHFSPVMAFFIIVPVMISIRAFESVARFRKETVGAVLKMAESIDYRDTGTYEHSQRLSDLTRKVSQTLGLISDHVSEIVLASRVHDLGKIGISNDILLKQGPLSSEERHIMEDHPVIGANILASYSAFASSVDIVKHHHERWDGTGYPDRLKGEQIPLGSRIISVVDAFDSMISDRPYRNGLSTDEAVERLRQGMWTQFDPNICAVFVRILIDEGVYAPPRAEVPELRIVPSQVS
jgi:HD domain